MISLSQVMVSLYSHSFLFDPVFRLLRWLQVFSLKFLRDRSQHFVSPIMSGYC